MVIFTNSRFLNATFRDKTYHIIGYSLSLASAEFEIDDLE